MFYHLDLEEGNKKELSQCKPQSINPDSEGISPYIIGHIC